MPAGITQQLSFVVPTDAPGKYKVTWGESTGEFAVIGADKTDTGNVAGNAIAPDFTAVDVVTNQKITLSQFKGSMVLLNFVNYGCDPSLNNIVSKQLLAIKALKNQRTDIMPVSVFCGCCPPEVLREFAKQFRAAYSGIACCGTHYPGNKTCQERAEDKHEYSNNYIRDICHKP